MKELTESEALYKASAYCSTAERCLSEMKNKLTEWGMNEEAQSRILKCLTDERFIDEIRYCRSFIKEKLRFNKWGKKKIMQALWQKQIPSAICEEELARIDEEEYLSLLRSLLAAKKRTLKANTEYERNGKLVRFAVSRGFEMEIILRCVKMPDDAEMDF